VLASDIEGNRSLIEDGVTGLLFTGPDAFADKATRLLSDAGLRRRLGEAGRARVARFGLLEEAERYARLYDTLTRACP
jgi:glycosyltransferase involved in cell wall biosynthesis